MQQNELHDSILQNMNISFARSGGKGGQNVNKVNTKVHISVPVEKLCLSLEEKCRLRVKLSGNLNSEDELFIDADDERYQERNRELAVERLEMKIINALKVQKKRRKTKPTKASKERRLKLKKVKSDIKKMRGKISY